MNKFRQMNADWIAIDWGTSNLRYWIMVSNKSVHFGHKPLGMAHLTKKDYEKTIIAELDPFLDPSRKTLVLICGMAGSKQGWKEVPYLKAPCRPPDLTNAMEVECEDPRISVRILPGICQVGPVDIMRGEETQIVGILSDLFEFDGVICLPGTHTKWVRISAGEIVGFQTFMTGELFSLLCKNSVLKHSVSKDGWNKMAFLGGVDDGFRDSKFLTTNLFRIRAESTQQNRSDIDSRSRLSGLLVGLELAGAKRYWLGQKICILEDNEISKAYKEALISQGVQLEIYAEKNFSLKGLMAIKNLENV